MKRSLQSISYVLAVLLASLGLSLAANGSAEPPPALKTAPDFTLYQSMNTDTLRLSDFGEHPVLLFFFDAGHVAHARAFPYVREWNRRYHGDGLRILGIHCPAFEPLKAFYNAITVLSRADIIFPVGMDADREVYRAYLLDVLPAFVLLEPGGKIVFRASGLTGYEDTEAGIQHVLKTLRPDIIHPFPLQPLKPIDDPEAKILKPTPMISLGHASGSIVDCDSSDFGKYQTYIDSRDRRKGVIYLEGRWKVDQDAISHEQESQNLQDYIRVIYSGKDVWLLPSFESGKAPRIYVKQDRAFVPNDIWGRDVESDFTGKPYIHMRDAIPTHVVSNPQYGAHELQLIPTQGEVTLFYLYFEGDVAPKSGGKQ